MADILIDKKITQEEAQRLMAPMELDLTAVMNIIKQDFITGLDTFKGTPEQYIEQCLNTLKGTGQTEKRAL